MTEKKDFTECLKCGACKPGFPISCISKLVKTDKVEAENINCRTCSQLCPVSCINSV